MLLSPVSVLDEKFTAELDKLKSTKAKASRIEHKLKKTITSKMHEDPAFYGKLEDYIKTVVEVYNAQRITDVELAQLPQQDCQ